LKKHYELRYNPDVEGKHAAAVLYIGEDMLPNDLFVIPDAAVEFGSIEEADMYLAASGFEKGEARHVRPFRCEGVEYRNAMYWEVRPCS